MKEWTCPTSQKICFSFDNHEIVRLREFFNGFSVEMQNANLTTNLLWMIINTKAEEIAERGEEEEREEEEIDDDPFDMDDPIDQHIDPVLDQMIRAERRMRADRLPRLRGEPRLHDLREE